MLAIQPPTTKRAMPLLTTLYTALAIGYLSLRQWTDLDWLVVIKPLPIVLLAIPTLKQISGWRRNVALVALMFAAIGDVTIQFLFVGGIAAFMLMQVCYIALFASYHQHIAHRCQLSLLMTAMATGVLMLIQPQAGQMLLPVVLYMAVILTMVVSASSSRLPLWPAVLGACLFTLSDSLIALNRFYTPLPLADAAVMATYYAGQFLIIRGFTESLPAKSP